MPTHPHAHPFRPVPTRCAVLLVALLGALLCAALSCSSAPHAPAPHAPVADRSPAAGAALRAGSTGTAGHPHPGPAHGFACSPSDPVTSPRAGTPPPPGEARPPAAPAHAAATAPPAADGPARARSGRSTLAVVCRWRL
ncbi:hypothetical protein ACFY15_09095 [Streptomyces sp. NPDC001373]|uniref:hypothetical protein n=1 Tax=Streptomyces sp. NPDC001373 TaxID=3364565 RepID=UPI003694B9C7